jgi:hypothetical protein
MQIYCDHLCLWCLRWQALVPLAVLAEVIAALEVLARPTVEVML